MCTWTKKWHILLNHCPIMHYTKFHRAWINIFRFTSVFINYEPCEHISSPKLLSFHCGFNLDLDFGHDSGHTKTFNLILTLNFFMTSTLDLTLAWRSITLVLDLKLMELDPDLVVNFDFQYYIVPHLLPWIFNWSWLDYDLSFDLHLNLWTSPSLYIYLGLDLEVEKQDPNLDLYLTMA